ncbi:HAD-IA family hydrolase [Streptomyces albus]|uniref:HAD-IA family hydrolase n=1 Tax=Streptomyces albus TaxID=1888 RepID=UPI00099C2E9F|nr:HAD-IA family hydrolase [Streptomyces albus]
MNGFPLAETGLPPRAADIWREHADGSLGRYGRALLFDLDGTLVDSAAAVERHTRAWAARCRLDADQVLDRSHGLRDSDLVALLAPTRDHAEEVAWLHDISCRDTRGVGPVPGAAALLAPLVPRDWAVVTSGAREVALGRLAAAGLPAPRVLVAAEDVAAGKPAPEGYLLAAHRLGVPPSECLAFEDAEVGVAAARAAGAAVVRVGGTGDPGVTDLRAVSVTPEAGRTGRRLAVRVAGGRRGAAPGRAPHPPEGGGTGC